MKVYYNEIDKYAAQWIKNLMDADLIPRGDIDTRSIAEVTADDIRGYNQCHFFAGIAGWSVALELADWPANRPVWTGSCPCQPFSSSGAKKAQSDERHLWPHWYRLIRECSPPTIFGEQVKDAIAFGWLDEVALDLEDSNYAFASAVLPACSTSAPHIRKRIWFVGSHSDNEHKPPEQEAWFGGQVQENTEPSRVRRHEGKWQSEKYQPPLPLLVDGVPRRMAQVRAFGNAIVPVLAAEFIKAYRECVA